MCSSRMCLIFCFTQANRMIRSYCSSFTQVVLKQFVGGFRPHYFEVCNPDVNRLKDTIQNDSSGIMFIDPSYCTVDTRMFCYVRVLHVICQDKSPR